MGTTGCPSAEDGMNATCPSAHGESLGLAMQGGAGTRRDAGGPWTHAIQREVRDPVV